MKDTDIKETEEKHFKRDWSTKVKVETEVFNGKQQKFTEKISETSYKWGNIKLKSVDLFSKSIDLKYVMTYHSSQCNSKIQLCW